MKYPVASDGYWELETAVVATRKGWRTFFILTRVSQAALSNVHRFSFVICSFRIPCTENNSDDELAELRAVP